MFSATLAPWGVAPFSAKPVPIYFPVLSRLVSPVAGSTEDLTILMADERVLAVHKPSGLLCVPGRGQDKQDCVLTRLADDCGKLWVVHRLDRDTSGVVLFARDAAGLGMLARQFQQRTVEKRYVALVAGEIKADQGRITWPLARDMARPPRYGVDYQHGLTAVTDYRVIQHGDKQTRLELTPLTGRSHQLRVHLSALGHPILGDPLYAPPAVVAMADRLCLHSCRLEIDHPDGGRRRFESAVPF